MKNKPKKYEYEDHEANQLQEPAEMIRYIKHGISSLEFNQIQKHSPFSLKQWAEFLHLSERTMQRYEAGHKLFEPLQTERILEIKNLIAKGVSIFNSKEKYHTWLNAPCVGLGNKKPAEFFDSLVGITLVNDELGRIEQGIFS